MATIPAAAFAGGVLLGRSSKTCPTCPVCPLPRETQEFKDLQTELSQAVAQTTVPKVLPADNVRHEATFKIENKQEGAYVGYSSQDDVRSDMRVTKTLEDASTFEWWQEAGTNKGCLRETTTNRFCRAIGGWRGKMFCDREDPSDDVCTWQLESHVDDEGDFFMLRADEELCGFTSNGTRCSTWMQLPGNRIEPSNVDYRAKVISLEPMVSIVS